MLTEQGVVIRDPERYAIEIFDQPDYSEAQEKYHGEPVYIVDLN